MSIQQPQVSAWSTGQLIALCSAKGARKNVASHKTWPCVFASRHL